MSASIGAGLGVLVALLWGSADILVTLAARHIGTLKTSLISQSVGMIALLFCGCFVFWFWHYNLTFSLLKISALIGILTGFCAAIGYYSFYYALEIGPVALVSPITASSTSLTFLLSILIHREQASLRRMGCIILVILGVTLASTNIRELRQIFRAHNVSSLNRSIYFAIIAMIAFGLMDFGIGVSATISGWFLPVLWTRFFSLAFLLLLVSIRRAKILPFTDKRFTHLREESSGFSRLRNGYSTSYKHAASLADPRFLADFPTVILSSNIRTNIHTRPSPLRRTTMVPFTESSTTIFEQRTLPNFIPKPPLAHANGNKGSSKTWNNLWIGSTILAGVIENIAVLIFSIDTRVATIGFASAIASSYSLVGAIFGVLFYHERLAKNQLCGIVLCIVGIFLLAV